MTHSLPQTWALDPSTTPLRVLSLTYHEILEDARILRQARALTAAGHTVTVASDWPKDRRQTQTVDGIDIYRFKWRETDQLQPAEWEMFDFLDSARPAMDARIRPFFDLCQRLRELNARKAEVVANVPNAAALDRSYYREHEGFARLRRKLSHMRAKVRLRKFEARHPNLAREVRSERTERNELRRLLRNGKPISSQALGLIYAANLMREPLPGGFDVVHAHDLYTLPAGVVLARRYGARLIYDAHEYEPARVTSDIDVFGPEAEALENDCLARVDSLITVGDQIADLYAARFAGPAPVVIMNAPEVDAQALRRPLTPPPPDIDVRKRAGLGDDTPLIVFTGGIQGEHRGVDKVLAALLELPDFVLVSMGPRNPRHDAWFVETAEALGVRSRTRLVPPVKAEEVPAAISSATLAVIPFQDISLNHRFAMPNKLFEAAFARIPLCVANLPAMRGFVEELGIGRGMDQTDPSAIAAAIREVALNREAYRPSREAVETLIGKYSWDAQVEKLTQLYAEVSLAHKSH